MCAAVGYKAIDVRSVAIGGGRGAFPEIGDGAVTVGFSCG